MYLPQLIDLVRQRYGFAFVPNAQDVKTGGARFQNGRLQCESGDITIENLDIYNDGIVAACRHTELAEAVLNDVIPWAMEAFGLRPPKTIIPRTYASFVIVDFKAPVSALISQFATLKALLAGAYESTYRKRYEFELSKTSFSVDPQTVPQHTNTEFLFDRRATASYDLNRYFCVAPLKTQDHLDLLAKVEGVFVSSGRAT